MPGRARAAGGSRGRTTSSTRLACGGSASGRLTDGRGDWEVWGTPDQPSTDCTVARPAVCRGISGPAVQHSTVNSQLLDSQPPRSAPWKLGNGKFEVDREAQD